MMLTRTIFCGVYSLMKTGQRRLRNNFLGVLWLLVLAWKGNYNMYFVIVTVLGHGRHQDNKGGGQSLHLQVVRFQMLCEQ